METVMEILKHIVNFLVLILCIAGLFYFVILMFNIAFSLIYSWFIEPIINFFKKRKATKTPVQISVPSPCSQCAKLKVECELLKEKMKHIEKEHDQETFQLCQDISGLRAQLDNYDGEFIKTQFDSIILSFINSKPLAPNVSVEHLARLCNVSEANKRFFRALLQEFEIENLTISKTDNGKHNIEMKLKSGENTYETTLTKCDCPDFLNRRETKVCKHMYFLALTLGLISSEHYDNFNKYAHASPDKEKIESLEKKK